MAGQQRGPRNPSTRGDFTGNQKEVLQKEHAEVLDQRREELGLINATRASVKDEGIIDLTSGEPVLEGTDQLIDAAARQPNVVQPEKQSGPEGTRLGTGTTTIDVHELPAEKPQAAVQKGEVLTVDMASVPALIRSLYDVEDVTIGYGNTFTFREGYRYRVPRWVAAHLEEKGLCLVLSLEPA